MRPLSKKAKADGYDDVKAAHDVLQELAHILVGNEDIAAREVIDQSSEGYAIHARALDDGEVHEYRLYRPTWAHGGVLAYVHHVKGQRPRVTAHLFERWIEQVRDIPYGIGLGTETKIACERLKRARRQIFDREFGPKCPGCGRTGVGTALGLALFCDDCASIPSTHADDPL